MDMGKYIVAMDQSTSASKAFLLDETGAIVARHSEAHRQFYPMPGRVEHDAVEICENAVRSIRAVIEDISPAEIVAIAISNQRETIVIWDPETGEPLCPAIVWQDLRGDGICRRMASHKDAVFAKTGLALSPYYSAAKAACALEESPDIQRRAKAGQVCIGTVDSYLVFRLTGRKRFQTDISNASRTQLMNLQKRCWDEALCDLFDIPMECLPSIAFSDDDFGETDCLGLPKGISITGVMGDSHGAFFGQGCHQRGMAKATYGTGSSVMMNIGDTPILSANGLSTSVGFGFQGKVCYVLEGNATCSGDTLCWLRDELGWVNSVDEIEGIAAAVPDTGGVYLVPAFSGLGAPYFDANARALLWGMSRGTRKAHILRAALESIAFQNAEIIAAMERDVSARLKELRVDGGGSRNGLLMQFQADLLGCPVQCAAARELSAIGVAYMAGLAKGVFASFEDIPSLAGSCVRYEPSIGPDQREALLSGWRGAVRRASFQP